MSFKKDLESLKLALDTAVKHNINLLHKIDSSKALLDYKSSQKKYFQERLEKSIKKVIDSSFELNAIKQEDELAQERLNNLVALVSDLNEKDVDEIITTIKKIEVLLNQVKIPLEGGSSFVKIPKTIPSDIKADIVLDLKELERCYENRCYRSSVILCGRVLETALHRKYYETTGQDILEKNPGIGLGNLIAKLRDKDVGLDPALTNQIHLINQVRVFSVHKKKEAFNPSEQQTQAMILYTLDVLEKIFSS